jgi:type I restriction enzyme S subunit
MAKKLSAAQRRYIENALLIAALGLTFNKLEEDYETKQLGEIADTTSGGTPLRNMSTYYGGNIPWIKSGELNDNLVVEAEEYITEEGLVNSSAKIYPKGTLVVALYGATVGKTGILGLDAASNQAVCAVFPKTKHITNEFIFWFLRHKRPEFLGSSFGGAQPNISQKIIRETQIPIPPLELQKELSDFFAVVEKRQNSDTSKKLPLLADEFSDVMRTVALIESLAARVNEAQRLRKEADIEVDFLVKSYLSKIFDYEYGDKLPQNWTWKSFNETLMPGGMRTGPFGTALNKSEIFSEGVPVFGIPNVGVNEFRKGFTDFVTPEKAKSLSGYELNEGDIAVARSGTVGRSCVVPKGLNPKPIMSSNLIRIRIDEKVFLPELMCRILNGSKLVEKHIDKECRGSTRIFFTQKILGKFQIPTPPLDEQRRIVAYLDGLQAKVNALRELQSASGEELSALMPSVLDRAFKGEL